VYNVVQGEGETGSLLTNHPGCDKLSFTGCPDYCNHEVKSGSKWSGAYDLTQGFYYEPFI
jgi:acyl-CoA reductase-like NAD-dependent aldehyde dehydrogenase